MQNDEELKQEYDSAIYSNDNKEEDTSKSYDSEQPIDKDIGIDEPKQESENSPFDPKDNQEDKSMVQEFGDKISDTIIDNNKNSDSAFDRGMGEFLENLDEKLAEKDNQEESKEIDKEHDSKEEEKLSIEIDKEAGTATITENGESREVSISEAFDYAVEQGEDKESIKEFAEKNGLENELSEDIKSSESEADITITFDKDNDKATITENGEEKEVSISEAFEYAAENGLEKEELERFANENGLSEQFEEVSQEIDKIQESNEFVEGIREQNEEISKEAQDFVDSAKEGYEKGVEESTKDIEKEQEVSNSQEPSKEPEDKASEADMAMER